MPNRIIKESICYSEDINKMAWFEECLFYRLWTHCDDYGRFDARPAILKGKLFPLKDRLTLKDIESALFKLADIGCVKLYKCDGKPYLYLPSWEVHQNIRAKRSKYPDPVERTAEENICMHMQVNVPDIQSNLNPNTNSPSAKDIDTFFENIWSLYPVKKGRGAISQATKKKLFTLGYDVLALAISRYKQEIDALGTETQFIKHGSTFFNSGYVDYVSDDWTAPTGPCGKSSKSSYDDELAKI